MSRMVQIRNVPEDVHREIKARAARAGMSLSDYLLKEVERLVQTRPFEDVLASVRARSRPHLSESPAVAVRAERDRR
jgi:antitoxin FitA